MIVAFQLWSCHPGSRTAFHTPATLAHCLLAVCPPRTTASVTTLCLVTPLPPPRLPHSPRSALSPSLFHHAVFSAHSPFVYIDQQMPPLSPSAPLPFLFPPASFPSPSLPSFCYSLSPAFSLASHLAPPPHPPHLPFRSFLAFCASPPDLLPSTPILPLTSSPLPPPSSPPHPPFLSPLSCPHALLHRPPPASPRIPY